jgi:hypothetical protein
MSCCEAFVSNLAAIVNAGEDLGTDNNIEFSWTAPVPVIKEKPQAASETHDACVYVTKPMLT